MLYLSHRLIFDKLQRQYQNTLLRKMGGVKDLSKNHTITVFINTSADKLSNKIKNSRTLIHPRRKQRNMRERVREKKRRSKRK